MSRPGEILNEISHSHYPSCLRAEKSSVIFRLPHPMSLPAGRLNETSHSLIPSCLLAGKLCVNLFLHFP
jgi:hypothetical protein